MQLDKDATIDALKAGRKTPGSLNAYSNINKGVKLSLTPSLSSAACERGSSRHHNKNKVQISNVTSSSLSPDAHSPVKAEHRVISLEANCGLMDGDS